MTTYTISTIPARAAAGFLRARPAVRVILADGAYFCDAPDSNGESAELIAGLIADEAERVAAAADRVAQGAATYTLRLAHPGGGAAVLSMDAMNEEEAIAECNRAVADGYRGHRELGGGTTGYVELAPGRYYAACNFHGEAFGAVATY